MLWWGSFSLWIVGRSVQFPLSKYGSDARISLRDISEFLGISNHLNHLTR